MSALADIQTTCLSNVTSAVDWSRHSVCHWSVFATNQVQVSFLISTRWFWLQAARAGRAVAESAFGFRRGVCESVAFAEAGSGPDWTMPSFLALAS